MCRSHRELELKLRIKPKKRLVPETPQLFCVPRPIDEGRSMELHA